MHWPDAEAVAAALDAHQTLDIPHFDHHADPERAGVLIPIYWDPDPVVVALVRSAALRHGGETSFPGGRSEPGESHEQTALREAEEELGIVDARVLGRLSSMPVYTSAFRLEPFVARVTPSVHVASPGEVDAVVHYRVRELLERPHLDALGFDGENGEKVYTPIFDSPGPKPMFGATAHTMLELLRILAPLFDRPVPPMVPGRWTWEEIRSMAGAQYP